MKLYSFERPTIVRVDIYTRGGACKTFSIDSRSSTEVRDELKLMLPDSVNVVLNPVKPLSKVTVQCYEHTGTKKGKNKSFTVYGLTVEEVAEIFTKNFEK